jgi:RES domain-containing protein
MPHPQWNAEEAVAAASWHPFSAKVWRVHWREVGPADWILSLRTSGRYHRGLDLFPSDLVFPALYTSLAPEIAIWEMVRRSAARNLAYLRNNVLTEFEVDLARVLDLSDPAALELTQADLTGADQQLCQDLAAAALALGHSGLLVPSAALPGLNLVLLPWNLSEPSPVRVVRSTDLPLEQIEQEYRQGGAHQDLL